VRAVAWRWRGDASERQTIESVSSPTTGTKKQVFVELLTDKKTVPHAS